MKKYVKAVVMSLSLLTVAGCGEAMINGVWRGSVGDFSPDKVKALITAANPNLSVDDIHVSHLSKDEFTVDIKNGAMSRAELDLLMAGVSQYQEAFTTSDATVIFHGEGDKLTHVAREWLRGMTFMDSFPEGKYPTRLRWAATKYGVYTMDNPFQNYLVDYIEQPVFCRIDVPFATALPKETVVDMKNFPPLTKRDIPQKVVDSSQSENELNALLEKKNKLRSAFMSLTRALDGDYPTTIIFNDDVIQALVNDSTPKGMSYKIENDRITFDLGLLPGVTHKVYQGSSLKRLSFQDMGGALHSKCKRMIVQSYPDLAAKIDNAEFYYFISLKENPDWKGK